MTITHRAEGIVLHTLSYRDYDQILTAFTYEAGVIRLIMRSGLASRRQGRGSATPLTRVELLYAGGHGDLYRGREVTVVDSYLSLRENFMHLQAGCSLLEAIRLSQQGERASPLLYQLLALYLNRLPGLANPTPAVTSFYLKVLLHDGLLDLSDSRMGFSEEELSTMTQLAICRRFDELATWGVEPPLAEKVARFFKSCLG